MHVHGNNVHTLHAHIPPRLLPAELGGEGGEYHASTWASVLLSNPTSPIDGICLSGLFSDTNSTAAMMSVAIRTAQAPTILSPTTPSTNSTVISNSSKSSKSSTEQETNAYNSHSTLIALNQQDESRPSSAYSTDQEEFVSASSSTTPEHNRPHSVTHTR